MFHSAGLAHLCYLPAPKASEFMILGIETFCEPFKVTTSSSGELISVNTVKFRTLSALRVLAVFLFVSCLFSKRIVSKYWISWTKCITSGKLFKIQIPCALSLEILIQQVQDRVWGICFLTSFVTSFLTSWESDGQLCSVTTGKGTTNSKEKETLGQVSGWWRKFVGRQKCHSTYMSCTYRLPDMLNKPE